MLVTNVGDKICCNQDLKTSPMSPTKLKLELSQNFLASKKKILRSQIDKFGSVNVVKEEIKINKWILLLCRNDFQYREWKIIISLHEHDHSVNRFWLVSTSRLRSRLGVDFQLDFEFDKLCLGWIPRFLGFLDPSNKTWIWEADCRTSKIIQNDTKLKRFSWELVI